METNETLITLLQIILSNAAVIIGAILLWRKSIKILPKEIKGAELTNQITEVSLATQLQNVAKNAAAQVLDYQKQLVEQDKTIAHLEQKLTELEPVVREVTQLRIDLDKYKELNDVLWQWANQLQNQVRPYETPVPMPTTKKGREK